MVSETRTRMPVEARRAQLLDLGFALFAERPFAAVSVDEIADRAGISKGLLYHYFPGKRDLYLACVRRAVDHMHAALEPDRDVPLERRHEATLDRYMDYVERFLPSFRNLLRGGNDDDPEVEAILSEMRRHMARRIAKHLGIDDPDTITLYCLVGYLGFCSFTCMAWVENGNIDRRTLRQILSDQLRGALLSAAALTQDADVRARIERVAPFLVIKSAK